MKRAPRWFIVASLAVWLAAVTPGAAAPATELMSKALNARASGKTDEAVSLLQQAIEASNRAAQQNLARLMLGDTLLDMNDAARALSVYDELHANEGATRAERAEAQYKKAQCQGLLGRWDAARTTARALIDGDPGSPYSELARAFLKTPKNDAATVVAPRKAIPEPALPKAEPVEHPAAPVLAKKYDVNTSTDATDAAAAPEPAVRPTSPPPVAVMAQRDAPTPAVGATKAVAQKPVAANPVPVSAAPARATPMKLSPQLARLLAIPTAEGVAREEIATRILQATNHYELDPKGEGQDKVLLDIASLTAQFGELVEACKRYDQLLREHPQSALVETAYFEAIRLRTILKVYGAAISWGDSFEQLFAASSHRDEVGLLIAHARASSGQSAAPAPGPVRASATTSGTESSTPSAEPLPPVKIPTTPVGTPGKGTVKKAAGPAPSADVAGDSRYRTAKREMADGHYEVALSQLQKLRDIYPGDPAILWDLALVLVQQENYRGAADVLDPLAQQQPRNAEVQSLLGYVHYQLKDLKQAEADYKQAGPTAKKGLAIYDPEFASRRVHQQADKAASRVVKSPTPAGKPVSRHDTDAAR